MLKQKLLFIAVLLCSLEVFSTNENILFRHLTLEDGLSNSHINCIDQDKDGFIWIGTENGLNKYDGYKFTTYYADFQNPSSLLSDEIFDVFFDETSTLWVATFSGLHRYNEDTDHFTIIPLHSKALNQSNKPILALTKDDKGNLWAASSGNGLIKFNIKENVFKTYIPTINNQASIISTHLTALYIDNESAIWVGSNENGFSIFNPENETFENYSIKEALKEAGNDAILCFYEYSKDTMLIGTRNGIFCFNRQTKMLSIFKHFGQNIHRKNGTEIYSIIQDHKNQIWVSQKGEGLIMFKKNEPKITFIKHKNNNKSLINDNTRSIFEDKQKNLWITSYQGGINILPNRIKIFENYNLIDPNKNNENSTITSITTDKKGNLWVGTDGAGLKHIDRKQNTTKHYYPNTKINNTIQDFVIMSLLTDKENNIWIGTYMSGLFVYNPNNQQFKNYKNTRTENSLNYNFVSALLQTENGEIWVGTNGNGLNKYNKKQDNFTNITMYDTIDGSYLISNWINTLEEDNNGRIWIGTYWGLSIYDVYSNHFINFKHSESSNKGLSSNVIYSILKSSKNEMWIGTRNGLNKFIPASNAFEKYNKLDGLPGNIIFGIEEDKNGNLWLSTNNGLCKFNPTSKAVQNYYDSDGLQSNEFFRGASYTSKQNEMFFGGINGLNSFYPDSIKQQYPIPKAYITNFKIFDTEIIPGKRFDNRIIIDSPISFEKEINLKHKDNSFTFEISALDYILPENTKYQCKMEGFDQNWKLMNAKHRYITYTNLDAGEYEFKVKASSIDGRWGKNYNSTQIYIAPPPYKTWWAFLIYYTLLLILLIGIYSLALRRIKLNNQIKLERLNREKSEELSQAKLRFFTNISHEFRTPLTLILGPIERILGDKNEPTKHAQSLNLVLKNARRLLRLINQLMDLRKIEMASIKLKVSKQDLVTFIKDIHQSFKEYAEQKNIQFILDSEKEELLFWFDTDKLDKILFNILSNAFKHTPQNGKIIIEIAPKMHNDNWLAQIRITDNGNGIPKEEQHKIFDRFYQTSNSTSLNIEGSGVGLSLTKALIDIHKGELFLESKEGIGTSFSILLPLDENIYSAEEKMEVIKQEAKHTLTKPVFEENASEITKETGIKENQNHTILIVEDNFDLRKYIVQELETNYSILEANNGASGFEIAMNKMPDLIISDVMMPEMDGLTLCRNLKENLVTNHIPIILLTAKTSTEQQIEGIEHGADSYIPKPFHPDHLHVRCKKLIELRNILKTKFSDQINNVASPKKPIEDKFLRKLSDIIIKNLEEPEMNIEWLSSQMGISRGHLHRKIKVLTDKSPSEFVRAIKLNEAANLLKKKEYNISEVSYMVGYNSPSYFANSFKNHFKISPTEFVERL